MIDEFTRKGLAIRVGRLLCFADVLDLLTELFVDRGTPVARRSTSAPTTAPR